MSILFLNEASLILTKLSVCISSGVRLYIVLSMNFNNHADSSCRYRIRSNSSRILAVDILVGNYYGVAVWSAAEINTAVISACLPTIRPVLQLGVTVFHSLRLSSKSSRNPALDATNSNVLKRKEGNVFDHLPDSPQGPNVPSKPAKGKHVKTTCLQVNLEDGDLPFKDEVV